ncbi:MAG: APC family permease [Saccharofermentanales bacterium]|jgi:APA family basic amino acid/polyamine antiporter
MQHHDSKNKLGMRESLMLLVGGMIGSAIYSLSGLTMYYAGPAVIITWTIAAAVLLMYGLQVAELAVRFPRSGGVYAFPRAAFADDGTQRGVILGWFSSWGYIFANIGAIAFAAIYVGTYLGAGFNIEGDWQIPLALIACLIVLGLNILKITITGKANTVLVTGLIVTMLIYVIVGLTSGEWNPANFQPFFTQGHLGATGFIQAIPNAMVAYGSIVAIAFMVSEVKDPNRTVPKTALYAMIIVVVLYLLCIITTLGLVTTQFLIDHPGMRFIPFYAAVFTTLQEHMWLAKVISISAVLALITTMLVVTQLTARTIAVAAQDGLLPKILGRYNKKTGTPIAASVVVIALSMIVSCFPHFTEQIVNLASLFAAITLVITMASLIVARKRFGSEGLAYRAKGGRWLPWLTILLIGATYIPGIIQGGWQLWAYTLGLYAIGALILWIAMKRHRIGSSAAEGK